ncbi:unnamed protein product [Rhizophagus irregularis]|nr:unnamed protein product [Rhizophagus irregularis]
MIMNKEEEIILINDDDKDLKFYFNSENNVHRQHNHTFLKKYLFKCNISSPVNENLISGGMVWILVNSLVLISTCLSARDKTK